MDRKTLYRATCLLICAAGVIPVCAQSVRINFQPPGEVPDGYLPDYGEVFGDRGNGFSYGWDADRMDHVYNRHSSSFADLKYDTVFIPSGWPRNVWEIAMEDGVYDLVVVCGNPRDTLLDNTLDVEGAIITDPDWAGNYDEYRINAPVSDGRLTISPESLWRLSDASVCFVEIKPHVPHKESFAPFPTDLALKVRTDVRLHWTPAQPAHTYNVYFGESLEDVNEAAMPMATGLDVNSFDPGRLELNQTYFWHVDEVDANSPQSIFSGPVWTFATHEARVVGDFERYNDTSPNRPWETWLDGFGYGENDHLPERHAGNGTGAGVGYDIWTDVFWIQPLMEDFITIAGSSQSMPFYYGFGPPDLVISQTDRLFDPPQDWSTDGWQTLVLHFYGKSTNAEVSLYVLINGEKVVYPDDEDLQRPLWHTWPIDLTTLGTPSKGISGGTLH